MPHTCVNKGGIGAIKRRWESHVLSSALLGTNKRNDIDVCHAYVNKGGDMCESMKRLGRRMDERTS